MKCIWPPSSSRRLESSKNSRRLREHMHLSTTSNSNSSHLLHVGSSYYRAGIVTWVVHCGNMTIYNVTLPVVIYAPRT